MDTPIYHQHDFPAEEFRGRCRRVYDAIGGDAVAIVQGAPQATGFTWPRQTNEFYYLCGIETPHAYLLLDGRTRQTTLLLPPRDERLEAAEGRILSAEDAELARTISGADVVLSNASMTVPWMRERLRGTAIYTPFAPAERNAECRHELLAAAAAVASDPWDGRLTREAHFAGLLRSRLPHSGIRDLTPILDGLRAIKSRREVALIRRSCQLAGMGIAEAMRCTRPGIAEYQLEAAARYVFLVNGAKLEAYRSITASGAANIWNMHYFRNQDTVRESDLVLMDFAPECGGYAGDVTRMWPASGRYLPWQRELLAFVVTYHQAILERIRPGVTAAAIQEEVREAMLPLLRRSRFMKPAYAAAAERLLDTGGGVFSHPVGMAVHDDGAYIHGPLQPGHVFAVDPQLRVPDEQLYIRVEDTVAVTEDGVENFTAFLPADLDSIEAIVGRGGIVQSLPPLGVGQSPEEWLKARITVE